MAQIDCAVPLTSASAFKAYATTTLAAAGALTDGPSGRPVRQIAVGTSGTVIVTKLDGTSETLPAFPDGYNHVVQCRAITGGTATNLVVYW